jgi:hypothetical protein
MAFFVNRQFKSNATAICTLMDGSELVFSQGKFDKWCIYHIKSEFAHAIKDVEIFTVLNRHSTSSKRFQLYQDFISVFDDVTSELNYDLVKLINQICAKYEKVGELQLVFSFLYAGMVAEENKQNAILKKYIKRLGVHQVLIEGMAPQKAANYSRGKGWRELDEECRARGFYADVRALKKSA